MRELGMALFGTFAIAVFFGFKIYPELEYTGGTSVSSCTGECYVEYVKTYGTVVEIEQRKQAYESIEEQLDMLYWDKINGTNNWETMITTVKNLYPKPTE